MLPEACLKSTEKNVRHGEPRNGDFGPISRQPYPKIAKICPIFHLAQKSAQKSLKSLKNRLDGSESSLDGLFSIIKCVERRLKVLRHQVSARALCGAHFKPALDKKGSEAVSKLVGLHYDVYNNQSSSM